MSRIKDFITIFLIQLVVTLPFYTANVYGLTISNVRVTKVTSNSATVEWDTDVASNGRVRYGKTTSLGFTQRHDNFIQNHVVTAANGVESDTNYFFLVESTDLDGNIAIDDNSNNLYTFKTNDITPPPKADGLAMLSKTVDSVSISWNNVDANDFDHYVVYRNLLAVANTTTNSFNDIGLNADTDYSYKVSAVDNSGNEGFKSDTLIVTTLAVDSTKPVISNVDILPITDTTAKVTWLTDENSTTAVLYGVNKTDKIKSSSSLETNHSIVIDGLTKNFAYLFKVISCDSSNNCANLSNHNFVAGKDITIPFINLSIPRFVNRRIIDIVGTTEPFSSVSLFVNNMNIPKRSLSSDEVGKSGKFTFNQIQLEQNNIIKIAITDKSGNKNQKTFEVGIDMQDPAVQLKEVVSLTAKSNVTFSGNVNEPVTIKVFIDADVNESSVTSKIAGLKAVKIGQNSIELQWNESNDKDFSHYVVYREDASPIAITKPANFNLFIDALVDSGRSYTYEISAVNIFGKEGPKSEPITVTTLVGGKILNLKYPELDIFEDFRKPFFTTNASGTFDFGIKLNKGDGTYNIKLVFEDRGGNIVTIQKTVVLDTKKPFVKIISPQSGAFIFENVANEVDVIGITKPNSRVHLFIDRTPFSFYNNTFEISGLPNELQNLPEAQLDAKCRSSVSASFCRTGADFSADADANGNFKFERVDLTAIFGGAGRIREVPVTQFRDEQLNREAQESRKTNILVIATDQVGSRGFAHQTVNLGTCWSGNQSWDVIPLTQYQSPTFLSTERFAEGTENIYFYFNYSYIGAGTKPTITGISISKACGTRELMDPRFNLSCQILPSGVPTKSLNPPENTLSYSAAQLSRFSGMDKFLENDWKSFLKAVNKELSFPLKIRITYKHDVDNDGDLETETQTTCEQVSYNIDGTLIDPRKVLPDWLLFDFVDFLQDSIKTLTDVQEQLDKLINFVAVGCLTSMGLSLVLGVYRRWVTFWDEKKYAITNRAKFDEIVEAFKLPQDQGSEQSCKDIIRTINDNKKGFKLKYVNDRDLKRCFPSSDAAWNAEANVYQFMRWSCDRIFGHTAPSAWTESKDDTELARKVESIEGCPIDGSERGQPLRSEKCVDLVSSFPLLRRENYKIDDICFMVNQNGKKALFKLGQPRESDIYELEKVSGPAEIDIGYAKKIDEFRYITAQSKTCQEICDGGKKGKKADVKIDGSNVQIVEDSKGSGAIGKCLTVQECTSLNAEDNKHKFLIEAGNKPKEIRYARTWGYTSGCFYDPNKPGLDQASVVGSSRETRVECCCISFTDSVAPPTSYYQPDDTDPIFPQQQVHQSNVDSLIGQEATQLGPNDFAQMKWSYRYSKEKFEALGADGKKHNEYNKNRYIAGRDRPACFGENDWALQNPLFTLDNPEKTLTIDPFRDHIASVQCAHLAGISNRIQFIKNLMTSLSTCLIQVRTTGRGDAGACKELFTQYLCNSIWQVIRFFVDKGCATSEPSKEKPYEENLAEYIGAGFKSVYGSISDLQSSLNQEYGNAKLNELLGTGEESVARKICLAAFGYDWEINVRNLVDAAYTTPFATLVQGITKSREFLTVNPLNLKPKYEYRASWIINPGCDFEGYEVYLSCIGRRQLDQYSNSVNCGAIGAPSIAYTGALGTSLGISQCDCMFLPDEKTKLIQSGKRLKQNVLEDKAFHQVIDDNYRYDHIKIVLRPDRRISPNLKPNCFPSGYGDGVFYFPLIEKSSRDVFDCRVDVSTGAIICGQGATFATKKGVAEFVDILINNVDYTKTNELVFNAGDPLKIDTTIRSVGQNKCLKVTFDGQSQAAEVFEGIQQYAIDIGQLSIGSRTEIQEPTGIRVQKISLGNSKDVSINVRFWDRNNDGVIDLDRANDEIYIDGTRKMIGDILNSKITTINPGDEKVEVSIENQRIILKKQDAEVAIVAVEIPRSNNGETIKDDSGFGFIQGTIRIFATIGATGTTQPQPSQPKQLIINLYYTFENSESGVGVDACNYNDAVIGAGGKSQERRITIRVELKPTSSSLQGPIITPQAIGGPFQKDKINVIPIYATITHQDGIKTPQLVCTRPDGNKLSAVFGSPQGSNKYEFDIFSSDLQVAGKYSCTITAESKNPQVRINTKILNPFEIQCGPENNQYGICTTDGKKCMHGSTLISGGLECKGLSATQNVEVQPDIFGGAEFT